MKETERKTKKTQRHDSGQPLSEAWNDIGRDGNATSLLE